MREKMKILETIYALFTIVVIAFILYFFIYNEEKIPKKNKVLNKEPSPSGRGRAGGGVRAFNHHFLKY
jgi:hypothetical protein